MADLMHKIIVTANEQYKYWLQYNVKIIILLVYMNAHTHKHTDICMCNLE